MTPSDIYEKHHTQKQRYGFSILEQERATWFLSRIHGKKTLLDLGCRDATLTHHFVDKVEKIVGVDVDRNALAKAKEHIPNGTFLSLDLHGDWQELAEQKFDVILCSEVLEHVYEPQLICEQIKKHLAPGGLFLGSVPNAFFIKHRLRYLLGKREGTPLEDPTHITQYNEKKLRSVLAAVQGKQLTITGYTRPPFHLLAERKPALFAYHFLFEVQT